MGWLIIGVLLFCIIQAAHAAAGAEDDRPLVDTKYGSLRGRLVTVKKTNRTVHAFLGVPFAQPPVGPLRFQKPEPPRPWSSVKDASKHSPICLQNPKALKGIKAQFKGNIEIPPVSEDCLYLNVFTLADREDNSKLPVMVFIHGGGFMMGSSIQFEASALSAYESVVVVTIQYRLGLLGFFSTGDEAARGNYGLLDQVAALQWVQENIKDFGGDAQSVTIFGQSAGGVSVSALVLSPLPKGLFHRAIAESGVALLPGLFTNKPVDVFIQNAVVNISGCHPDAVVECLKKKTAEEILTISSAMPIPAFPICVDGVILPKPLEEILAGHGGSPVPFMIGVNEQEFGWMILRTLNLTGLADGMDMDTVVATFRRLPLLNFVFNFMSLVMEEYFGDTTDPHEIRDRFVDLCGDLVFVIPALKTANYHRDAGHPVFIYEFQHRPSLFHDTKPDFVKADHSDELIFVSGAPFSTGEHVYKSEFTEEEEVLSRTMMKYWANFARSGNPNGPDLVQWPAYDGDEGYLAISLEQKAATRLKRNRLRFWTETFPQKVSVEQGDHVEL
ncbi:fatty acyl-CoA hydrolase precursor, medium chain-like [Pseudophryne corroboree]|uniref:fatty acyl-CoA hydrolase precursor, medium chain-like n=1 Tax=Pseudophryne corroboree TaxID=495146 RepID=UPI003081F4EF